MSESIEKAKNDFLRAKGQLESAFATTPDDRVNWSPSPTARTPIALVVHSAMSIKNIHGFMQGIPFEKPNPAEADVYFREEEAKYNSREAATKLLNDNSEAYVKWLDELTEDKLGTLVTAPFGMGQFPLALAITFPPLHTMEHAGQLRYVQTIYGDRDWHF